MCVYRCVCDFTLLLITNKITPLFFKKKKAYNSHFKGLTLTYFAKVTVLMTIFGDYFFCLKKMVKSVKK